MFKIKGDQLAEEVQALIWAHTENYAADIFDATVKLARKGARRLRKASRQAFGKGEYSEGWKVTTRGNRRHVFWSHMIYNEHPGLPHLLEHGHTTRNGTGRTYPATPAHPHIEAVHDELIEEYKNMLDQWF